MYGGAISRERSGRLRALLRSIGFRQPLRPAGTNGRRAVILHLDGVSRRVLERAAREGRLPFLSRLLSTRDARLAPFLAGAPASTSAFQAGLLYGHVDDVPGYIWLDKRRGDVVRMDQPEGVTSVESRHERRDPGLLAGGTSYATLFAAGATPPVFNLGRAWQMRWNSNFRHWPLAAAAAVNTALGASHLTRLVRDVPGYIASGVAWSRKVGRTDWEWRLVRMRALASILLRDVATWGTIGDIAIGAPVIYTCFVDYDEVAHRRGPNHPEALAHLEGLDRCVERIYTAAAAFPELGYDVFVLADHGMVDATPFEAIAGENIASIVRRVSPRARVIDAGDLAHLYFTEERDPLPLEAIVWRHRPVLEALRTPGVPLIAARSEHGPVVIASGRTHHLGDAADRAALAAHPVFSGRDVETLFAYVARLVGMRSAGDLVLYGNPSRGHAVAYSWEFGSHGGLATDELESFVLHDPRVDFAFSGVRVPEELHRAFLPYRPALPRQQDVIGAPDVLADPSPDALRSGCDHVDHPDHADHADHAPPA